MGTGEWNNEWLQQRWAEDTHALRKCIKDLLKGIRQWAADEDGVHPDACDAYDRAAIAIGEKPLKEADDA